MPMYLPWSPPEMKRAAASVIVFATKGSLAAARLGMISVATELRRQSGWMYGL